MESDLTHTSQAGVVYLPPLVARGLVKEHSDRLGRVTPAVSICYYLVAQTLSIGSTAIFESFLGNAQSAATTRGLITVT